MKLTFPNMGALSIAVKAAMELLGVEVVLPPQTTRKTMELGTRHSPELACIPFKIILGSYLEVLEKKTPDHILMIGDFGGGSCRLGFYNTVHQAILNGMGYDIPIHTLDTSSAKTFLSTARAITGGSSVWRIARAVQKAFLPKLFACEWAEKLSHKTRPYELKRGDTTKVYRWALKRIDEAPPGSLRLARREILKAYNDIPQDRTRNPIRIIVIGELYVLVESFVNMEIEEKLGHMGVYLERSFWVGPKFTQKINPFERHHQQAMRASRQYLGYRIGAECDLSIGDTILYARKGYDGVIHLMPFTCMPEIVAEQVLLKVSRDYGIPVLTFALDQHAGEAGMITRLEAFVDLLQRRRDVGVLKEVKV